MANISNTAGSSILSSIQLDSKGVANIVWEDWTFGSGDAFFIKWDVDKQKWVDSNNSVYNGSINGNANVTKNNGQYKYPSIDLSSLDYPGIVWLDNRVPQTESFFVQKAKQKQSFNFSVKITDPFEDYTKSPICNQAEFWHVFDNGNHTKSNKVCNSEYVDKEYLKSLFEVKKTAVKYAYSSTEIISFVITVANTGKKEILGVNLTDSFPRELEFYSSLPKGSNSNGTVKFVIGTLKVGEKRRFELKFKLAKNTNIPENGLYITNIAKAFSSASSIDSTDTATVLITRDAPLKDLILNVLWTGLNTKTNSVKQGEEVSAKVMPEGGSSPYEILVEWGDGQKDKASEITLENYPTFTHTFSGSGEYNIKITCTDQYGKQCKVVRKITVK
jgi:uncharacterized repeat protein (TIGR01451 family)